MIPCTPRQVLVVQWQLQLMTPCTPRSSVGSAMAITTYDSLHSQASVGSAMAITTYDSLHSQASVGSAMAITTSRLKIHVQLLVSRSVQWTEKLHVTIVPSSIIYVKHAHWFL